MIKSVTFSGLESGPRLLVLGAVHGNEKCGTVGILRIIAEIETGTIGIARGQVTFVPVANPDAFSIGKRFVERNLNRYLVPTNNPTCYEAKLGNILCPLLASADVLLDIHSYTVGGEAFIFVGPPNPRERAFAASLGPHTLLTGWGDAYAATGRKVKSADDEESTGTTEYARRFGAIAVTIECGQHDDVAAIEVAYTSIRNALRHLAMTTETEAITPSTVPRVVTVTQVIYRDSEGTFPKRWKHLDPVTKGEIMACQADGEPIRAPDEGFIILPHAECELQHEWFYFGVER
jgi:uncharacterized protein